MAEDRHNLSLRLYDVLESVGASEEIRRLHRRIATTTGILDTLEYSLLWEFSLIHSYLCGSFYEGSVTPDLRSDIDQILCCDDEPVVLDPQAVLRGCSLLMIRDDWTHPGYVKLQEVVNGRPLTIYDMEVKDGYDTDCVGRMCMKHYQGENMQGPASMGIDKNGRHIIDGVVAYRCENIPAYAREWIIRHRMHEWPSQQQLIDMSTMGCLVVGVGHVDSEEKEIEWRVSFSLQERLLMSSLNPVQHKVYILLKMIKKDVLEKVLHEQAITSYHCKTCVLHVVENTPARVWTQGNIINCLLLCLTVMSSWVKIGFCPNYFMKDQNLFDKEEFRRHRYPLLELMRLLLQTGHQFITLLQSDQVGGMLKDGGLRVNHDLQTINMRQMIFHLKFHTVKSIVTNYPLVLYAVQCYIPRLLHTLEILQNMPLINGHSVEESTNALVYLQPWLHLHIAMVQASGAYREIDRSAKRRRMEMAEFHFLAATKTNLVNTRLVKASILFRSGKHDMCLQLLQQIEQELTYRVLTVCSCTGTGVFSDKYEISEEVCSMSVTEVMANLIVSCVIFLPSEFEITPVPLQYEMFRSLGTLPGSRNGLDYWFDFAVVDAKVFLYFMLYMVSTKLDKNNHKRVAIDNLQSTILHDCRIYHRETAYNLLGWIYLQEQRVADAIGCFRESWKIRPFHNAAKFHMRDAGQRLPDREMRGFRPNFQ